MSPCFAGGRIWSLHTLFAAFGLSFALIVATAAADPPNVTLPLLDATDAPVVVEPEKKTTSDEPETSAKDEGSVPSQSGEAEEEDPLPTPDEQQPLTPDLSALGDPLARGIVALMKNEIIDGLKRRNIVPQFARFQAYSRQKLDSTAGVRATSEVTGNCRLDWYDSLMRNPLDAAAEAEKLTRELHHAIIAECDGLDRAVVMMARKLDLKASDPVVSAAVNTPDEAIEAIKRALTQAQVAYAAALEPLTGAEVQRLSDRVYATLTRNGNVGHTLSDRSSGRYMCDLFEKTDRARWIEAVRALVPLTQAGMLDQLAALPDGEKITVEGVTGDVVRRISTPSGDIVIGGRGANTYQLDAMPGVAVVVDLGGDDIYHEGTCSLARPVLIAIDLEGHDRYLATKPGTQGGAVLGISMLLDRSGDDFYQATDVAQGSCIGGVGILIDYDGNDVYAGVRRLQGQAIAGLGVLIDRKGNDRYHAALWAQGFGGPLGFGVLDDMMGDDHYYVGGLYLDSYDETPGQEGWGQGVGAGIRQVANGGVGAILDGGGDDVYEYDYLSHGGGYWLGVGLARDFAGNDQRIGATRKAFNGSPRTERRFVRFGCGWGCHYAAGFLFDDQGDDLYTGTIMSVGFGWDLGIGILTDFAGNDRYDGNAGNGAQASLGVVYDYAGDDEYVGGRQGSASGSISYHDLPYCGGNFSFVIDYGGEDRYGSGARNNSYVQRGSAGGFLIDRPKKEEIEEIQTETAGKSTESTNTGG
ncbi:MAG TPA: hypothetical protein DD670_00210 [Planctomycetaceae bacterium]|nr:hypothetical protein [Planctomycetaceae bacterium]